MATEAAKVCPACTGRVGDLANFCNQCGKKLSPSMDKETVREREKFATAELGVLGGACGKVGHAFQKGVVGAKYCLICGKDLSKPEE